MASPRPTQDPDPIPPDHVQVGTVAGVHGNDGRLRVALDSDNPDRFRAGSVLRIGARRMTVRRTSVAPGGTLLVKLDGLDSRQEASELVHERILVPVADVPAAPPGTYYHYQLLDMVVVAPDGRALGRIAEVLMTGANDVYVVASEGSELLVPALADVVVAVDVEARRMTVAVPPGLEPRLLKAAKPAPARRRRRRPGPRPSRPS